MAMMGQRAYSRHRGCALRAVQKAIEAGRIKLVTVDGKSLIDSDQADRDWQLNTDAAKQSLLRSTGPASPDLDLPAAGQLPAGEGEEPAAGDANALYRESRGSREQLRLERERYEFEQLRGQLIDVDEARRLAFTAFRTLRDGVLSVPIRLKDELAAMTDALLIEQRLDAELSIEFGKFDPARVLVEADDGDDDED